MNQDHGICRLGWVFRKRHRVRGRNKGNVDRIDNSDDGRTTGVFGAEVAYAQQ